MRRALLLAALLLVPLLADAQAPAKPREVSILVYHVSPDPQAGTPQADPYSGPASTFLTGNGSLHLPLTRIDGAIEASDAPEGDPASASAHFQEVRRLVQEREAVGAPLAMTVNGEIRDGNLTASVTVDPQQGASGWRLAVALIEDGLAYEGGSGVRIHRFVVRDAVAPDESAVDAPALTRTFALSPTWDAAKLGIVAYAIDARGEALQSATWLASQHAPTEQRAKAVLIQQVTATWCEPCAPSDEALLLLASQYGFPAEATGAARGYGAVATPLAIAGLIGGAALGLVLLRRRASP